MPPVSFRAQRQHYEGACARAPTGWGLGKLGVVSCQQRRNTRKLLEDASAAAELPHMHTRVTIAHVYTGHHHQAGGVREAQSSEDRTPLVVGSSVARNRLPRTVFLPSSKCHLTFEPGGFRVITDRLAALLAAAGATCLTFRLTSVSSGKGSPRGFRGVSSVSLDVNKGSEPVDDINL